MAISFKCPGCGKSHNVGDELAGKKARCKCGQEIVVPEPALPGGGDAMSALLDAELPPTGEEPPLGQVAAARPAASALGPVAAAPRKSQSGTGLLLWIGIGAGTLAGLALLLVLIFLFTGQRKPAEVADVADKPAEVADKSAPPAYASPEEVYQANLKATVEKDWDTVIRLWTPESQGKMVGGIAAVAAMAVMMGGDDSKIAEVMGKHGIDEALWKLNLPAAGNPSEIVQAMQEKSKALAAAVNDKPAFFAVLTPLVEKRREEMASKLKLPGVDLAELREKLEQARKNAKLVDVQIDGDTAQGQEVMSFGGKEMKTPVEFRKIDGSWLLYKADVDFSKMGTVVNPLLGGEL